MSWLITVPFNAESVNSYVCGLLSPFHVQAILHTSSHFICRRILEETYSPAPHMAEKEKLKHVKLLAQIYATHR